MSKLNRDEGFSGDPGPTLSEVMEQGLDEIFEALMEMRREGWGGSDKELAEMQGQARGFAWCMALFRNPYLPEDELVKIKAALVRRYESREVV